MRIEKESSTFYLFYVFLSSYKYFSLYNNDTEILHEYEITVKVLPQNLLFFHFINF